MLHVPGRVSSGPDTFMVMAKQKGPTAEDRAEAIRVALSGIAHDLKLGELAQRLAPLHPKNNTFPGEVLLELAADAIEEAVQPGNGRSSSKASAGVTFPKTGPTRRPSTTRPSMRCGRRRWSGLGSIPPCSTRSAGGAPMTCGSGRLRR